MRYDFIAELFLKENDEIPRYRTRLNGVNDERELINKIGMAEDNSYWNGVDYLKEMDLKELTEFFSLEENPELASVISEGNECSKVILHAYEIESGFYIGCNFGKDKCFFAQFEGNAPESKVLIKLNSNSSRVMQIQLKRLKARMDVLTLFEVMDRLVSDYDDIDESSCDRLKEDLKKR